MTMADVARRRPLIAARLAVAVLVVAAGNAIGVAAQIGAPPALPACPSFILVLSPCLGYFTGVTNSFSPICCAAITTVVNNAPACLCQFFATPNPLGFPVNLTRVRNLPGACMIGASSIPQCSGSTPPPLTTPPQEFFPAPPKTGIPIPAPGTPSASSPLPFRGRPSPPSVHNTSNSSTGTGAADASALSRTSAMGVCLGVFFAIGCFM